MADNAIMSQPTQAEAVDGLKMAQNAVDTTYKGMRQPHLGCLTDQDWRVRVGGALYCTWMFRMGKVSAESQKDAIAKALELEQKGEAHPKVIYAMTQALGAIEYYKRKDAKLIEVDGEGKPIAPDS